MQRAAPATGPRRERDEGSPGRHPDGNASPPAPPSPQQRPHGRGPAPEVSAQSLSLRALAPHARSAPLAAGRGRGCGRVRSRLGGRRPAPPRLLGNVHASLPHTATPPPPPPPLTHLFGIAAPTTHIPTSNKPELLKVTKQQPVEEGGEAQRFKEDQHSNVCFLAIVPLTLATFLLSLQERPGNPAGSGYLLRFYI